MNDEREFGLRRLDPRAAFILLVCLVATAFVAPPKVGGVFFALLVIATAVGCGSRRALSLALLAAVFGAVVNVLFVRSGLPRFTLPLVGWTVTDDGVREALRIGFRMGNLVLIGMGAMRVADAVTWSEAIGALATPFARPFGSRVHRVLFQLRLAVAFVPAIATEATRIVASQRMRGLRFDGSLRRRLQLLPPLFVPVWVGAMVQASRTGLVLAARGIRTDRPHRYLPEARWRMSDTAVVFAGGLLVALVIGRT